MAETILFSREQIKTRVNKLAQEIANDYAGKDLVLISILRGAFIVTADLLRALYEAGLKDVDVEFMRVSSYESGEQTTKEPKVILDLTTDIANKHVLIVEDIIDTGYTLAFLKKHLEKRKPASLKILAFLDKKEKREVEVPVDYTGFIIKGSPWVEGYGLDGGEFGRGRPDVAEKVTS